MTADTDLDAFLARLPQSPMRDMPAEVEAARREAIAHGAPRCLQWIEDSVAPES
ncbi:hypothetical protein [Streptomyces cellulosae]|uniref:Uncharacterized protein n=1 Tax=Streptomyces cellulosae TaxID=1968 RepID=A0ABW7Y3J0_STRCE